MPAVLDLHVPPLFFIWSAHRAGSILGFWHRNPLLVFFRKWNLLHLACYNLPKYNRSSLYPTLLISSSTGFCPSLPEKKPGVTEYRASFHGPMVVGATGHWRLRGASAEHSLLRQLKKYTEMCKIISSYVAFLAWGFWAFLGLGSETWRPSALLQIIGKLTLSFELDPTAKPTCCERRAVSSVLLKLSVPARAPPACQAHSGVRQLISPDPIITCCRRVIPIPPLPSRVPQHLLLLWHWSSSGLTARIPRDLIQSETNCDTEGEQYFSWIG